MSLFPLASFDRIENEEANALLLLWGHYLEACDRPFAVQSFGLQVDQQLVSVAVSASTVSALCAGRPRTELVELARCCSRPGFSWATRITLRLWRQLAPQSWEKYWPVRAMVSYSDALRHTGNLYRFDGWTLVGEVRGGVTGPNSRTSSKAYPKKKLWLFERPEAA